MRRIVMGRGMGLAAMLAASLVSMAPPDQARPERKPAKPAPETGESRAARRRAEKSEAKARSQSPRHRASRDQERDAPVPWQRGSKGRRRWPIPR